jgi:hypothetical protein
MFDFPTSPTPGQIFTAPTGSIYRFNGSGWDTNPAAVVSRTSAILTKVVAMNTAPITLTTAEIEILSTTITIKNAASKLFLKGYASLTLGAVTPGPQPPFHGNVFLYTDVAVPFACQAHCTCDSYIGSNYNVTFGTIVTHGKAIGTTLRCWLTASRGSTGATPSKANIPSTVLSIEEVL